MYKITTAVVLVALFAFAQTANAVPTATYDPATGNISWSDLSVEGEVDTSLPILLLISESASLLDASALGDGGVDNGDVPNAITWFTVPYVPASGALDAGNIVTPNTDINTLSVQYFNTLTSGSLPGEVVPIPEPGTLALVGMGLIGLVAMRRRRAY